VEETYQIVRDTQGEATPRDETVRKSIEQREQELRESLSLLQDALVNVHQGDVKYLKVIACQLRALICFGDHLNPLLLNLAEEKKVSLECFALPIDELLKFTNKPLLVFDPRYAVSYKQAAGLKQYEFKKWLISPYLVLREDQYTPNNVIR
jgi:hypothetical protein